MKVQGLDEGVALEPSGARGVAAHDNGCHVDEVNTAHPVKEGGVHGRGAERRIGSEADETIGRPRGCACEIA